MSYRPTRHFHLPDICFSRLALSPSTFFFCFPRPPPVLRFSTVGVSAGVSLVVKNLAPSLYMLRARLEAASEISPSRPQPKTTHCTPYDRLTAHPSSCGSAAPNNMYHLFLQLLHQTRHTERQRDTVRASHLTFPPARHKTRTQAYRNPTTNQIVL